MHGLVAGLQTTSACQVHTEQFQTGSSATSRQVDGVRLVTRSSAGDLGAKAVVAYRKLRTRFGANERLVFRPDSFARLL